MKKTTTEKNVVLVYNKNEKLRKRKINDSK